jgi:tripartite-type tricarboxylate transporter receptor subunit TctC
LHFFAAQTLWTKKVMNQKFGCLVKLVIGFALLIGASGTALGEEFYKGKTILFIVGLPPGGGYDTYTRAVARHIGKYIPGNPASIVQNMVGAGSLVTAHYIYNKAKPDGLTVGVWNSGLVLRQALGERLSLKRISSAGSVPQVRYISHAPLWALPASRRSRMS